MRTADSFQIVEQGPCFLQVGGVEALGEPAVEGCQQVARLAPAALLAPQPGEARRGAQFVAACALLAGYRQAVRNESSAFAGSGYANRPVSSPRNR